MERMSVRTLLSLKKKQKEVRFSSLVAAVVFGTFTLGMLGLGLPVLPYLPMSLLCAGLTGSVSFLFLNNQKPSSTALQKQLEAKTQRVNELASDFQIEEKHLEKAIVTKPEKYGIVYVNHAYFLDEDKQIHVIRETTSDKEQLLDLEVLGRDESNLLMANVYPKKTKNGICLVKQRKRIRR